MSLLKYRSFFLQASRKHFPHNGWKILARARLALFAKCEMARLDQYIWRNLVARFPTRRLFDAGHLKLVGLGQFVFLLHPHTQTSTNHGQRARFSRIRAGVKLAALSKTVNNVIRNSVQYSSLRFSRKVALGETRTLHRMILTVFFSFSNFYYGCFCRQLYFIQAINSKIFMNYMRKIKHFIIHYFNF